MQSLGAMVRGSRMTSGSCRTAPPHGCHVFTQMYLAAAGDDVRNPPRKDVKRSGFYRIRRAASSVGGVAPTQHVAICLAAEAAVTISMSSL